MPYPTTLYKHTKQLADRVLTHSDWNTLGANIAGITAMLGLNPQASYGTIEDRLDAIEAQLTGITNGFYKKITIENVDTFENTRLQVKCEKLAVEGSIITDVNVTIDITVAGKNGRTSAEAASTWYGVWIGVKPATGEVAGIYDVATDRTLLTLSDGSLSGFTRWRRVGMRYNNASSNLVEAFQQDQLVFLNLVQEGVLTTDFTADSTFRTRTMVNVPPTSRLALVGVAWSASATAALLQFRTPGMATAAIILRAVVTGILMDQNTFSGWLPLSATRSYEYNFSSANISTATVYCLGYHDPF